MRNVISVHYFLRQCIDQTKRDVSICWLSEDKKYCTFISWFFVKELTEISLFCVLFCCCLFKRFISDLLHSMVDSLKNVKVSEVHYTIVNKKCRGDKLPCCHLSDVEKKTDFVFNKAQEVEHTIQSMNRKRIKKKNIFNRNK